LSATHQLLGFGIFELNLATAELRKSGMLIKLQPQPFQLLVMLASHAGQVVTRDAIQMELWSVSSEVDFEHGMRQCIAQIRTALGDHAESPRYVETIPRQGYRFLAPVESRTIPVAGPRLVASDSGERGRAPVLIGRGAGPPAAVAGAVVRSYAAAAPDAEAATELARDVADIHKSRSRVWQVRLLWIGVAVVLVALIGGGLYWRAHKTPVLTEKDTIVLADFDNSAGDQVFDDTLKQGLTIQLEQSPFLNVLSDRKVAGTLKLMNRSGSERLTEDMAHEVCLRTNSKAMLTGSIARLGHEYVIGLKAVDCNTGEVLADVQEQAAGKEGVLKALDAAAVGVRSKLGESLSSVQKYATPLEEASTPSLEALKAYSMGRKTQFAEGNPAALPFFKRAAELDPNFAVAYGAMGSVYYNLGEIGRAVENARKAYESREKVSERERFYIEANYYTNATGELEKAARVYELWQQTYPRDHVAYANLGSIYGTLGNWETALGEFREAIRLEPNDVGALGDAYLSLNRLDEAEAVYYKEAEKRKLESEHLLAARYQLAFLKSDTAQMRHLASAAMGKPGAEDMLLGLQADTEGWYGKLKNARELTRQAMDSAQHNDAKETAAEYQAAAALREVESGNRERARAGSDAAVNLAPNRDVRAMAALALARAGDIAGARKLAAELDKTFPLDTLVQRYWLPTIGAAVALQQKDPNRAVELLKEASTIELGQPTSPTVSLCPVYLRGEAYLMLYDGNAAAGEFRKFIDHYGLVGNFPWGALARLGVARAYALDAATDPAARGKAREAYQNFLSLWKDADPDVPIYQQAKAEYATLH
jgi:eukaryotic-like serine/threonine-protein kinase